jgi:hypothetical protein
MSGILRRYSTLLIVIGSLCGCGNRGNNNAHRPFPQVTYGGGRLLSHMRLVFVVAASDPDGATMFAFCDALVASNWWSTVAAPYNVDRPSGCVHLTGGDIPAGVVTDAYMKSFIGTTVASAPSPPTPDGNTMYLLVLPPNVFFKGAESCQYSGNHAAYGRLGDAWGVVQRCQFDFSSVVESLTVVASHEIIEAATDPDTTTGWGLYPSPGNPWDQSVWLPYGTPVENGDFCNDSHTMEGAFWYQRIFSNAAAATGGDPCIPPQQAPYYDINVPKDWYALPAGQSITIPINGWSVSPVDPWQFDVDKAESSTPTASASVGTIDAPTVVYANMEYHGMSAGQTANVTITMGAAAPSQSWQTFWIYSYRLDAQGNDGLGGDDHDHVWRFGVYVP